MDIPAKDRKHGPTDSTTFLSKDRLCGHSTRLSNFKVTQDLETDTATQRTD